jgi:hypothetical protein
MAFSRVQATGKVRVDGGTSIALTFASPPAVGNAVLVPVIVSGTRTWPGGACTDNQSNTYALAISRPGDFTGSPAVYYCAKVATSGTPFTITLAPGFGAVDLVATAVDYSGVGGGLAVHQTSTAGGNSAAPNTGALPTVTIANTIDVIVMAINAAQTAITVEVVTPPWVEEWEELPITPYVPGEADSRMLTVAPTLAANWTASATGWWAGVRAIFNATAAPAVPARADTFVILPV